MNDSKANALIQLGLPPEISRRRAIQWVMAAVAASAMPAAAHGQAAPVRKDFASPRPGTSGAGYGPDAKLTAIHHPGDLWPLTFTDAQKKIATTAALVIIPDDQYGPAAPSVGVVPMIDEW